MHIHITQLFIIGPRTPVGRIAKDWKLLTYLYAEIYRKIIIIIVVPIIEWTVNRTKRTKFILFYLIRVKYTQSFRNTYLI